LDPNPMFQIQMGHDQPRRKKGRTLMFSRVF
jgi:hypothetical protein